MEWTDAQIAEYNNYLDFLQTTEGKDFPHPKDIADYYANVETWKEEWGIDTIPEYEWTMPQKSAYERYKMYADLYGDPEDWYAEDIKTFFDNYDIANEQLDEWETEATREYSQYKNLGSYREPKDWYAADLDDFVANWEQAQTQQDTWLTQYEEDQVRQQQQEEYYDWQRQTAYKPDVQYDPAFYKRQEALQGESIYYQNWMREMFPELQQRFEATQPQIAGYPTLGESEAAKAQTEQAWEQYLYGQTPELREEFYSQPPSQRGEYPQYYAQRLRQVSYP